MLCRESQRKVNCDPIGEWLCFSFFSWWLCGCVVVDERRFPGPLDALLKSFKRSPQDSCGNHELDCGGLLIPANLFVLPPARPWESVPAAEFGVNSLRPVSLSVDRTPEHTGHFCCQSSDLDIARNGRRMDGRFHDVIGHPERTKRKQPRGETREIEQRRAQQGR